MELKRHILWNLTKLTNFTEEQFSSVLFGDSNIYLDENAKMIIHCTLINILLPSVDIWKHNLKHAGIIVSWQGIKMLLKYFC